MEDPGAALAHLKEHPVDAFLVDLDMPKVKGTLFATLVRQQGLNVPIGICTGNCVDQALIAKALQAGPVLPKIWTHTDLRKLLRALQLEGRAAANKASAAQAEPEDYDSQEEQTRTDFSGAHQVQPLAQGTGATSRDTVRDVGTLDVGTLNLGNTSSVMAPAPTKTKRSASRVSVRCRSWEQVRKLCGDVIGGLTTITVRARLDLLATQEVVLALSLPDEMVVSFEATVLECRSQGPDGKRSYQLDLVGFGNDEMQFLLERCDENDATAPEATAPIAARPRQPVPLAPSTPDDARPVIPESIDSVDLQDIPSYAPKISWD